MVSHTGKFQSRIVLQRALELVKSHTFLICIFFEIVSYKGDYNLILCLLFFVFKLGVPISGFQVEAVGGVIFWMMLVVGSLETGLWSQAQTIQCIRQRNSPSFPAQSVPTIRSKSEV